MDLLCFFFCFVFAIPLCTSVFICLVVVIFVGRDTQNNYDMVIEFYIGMNTTRSI